MGMDYRLPPPRWAEACVEPDLRFCVPPTSEGPGGGGVGVSEVVAAGAVVGLELARVRQLAAVVRLCVGE